MRIYYRALNKHDPKVFQTVNGSGRYLIVTRYDKIKRCDPKPRENAPNWITTPILYHAVKYTSTTLEA